MPQGFQAVLALLVLLPGFVSARIARSISSPAEQTDIERIIDALVFSFYIYLFYLFLFGANLSFALNFSADAVRLGNYGVRVFFWRLMYLCIAPPVLGVLWGALEHRDSLLGFLRRIKFTDRTNDVTVWNGTLKALSGTVQVGLGDDREIAGWLQRYSDIGAERSLFLERAAWIGTDGKRTEIPGPGVLLTDKAEIRYIMFLHDDASSSPKEVLFDH